MDSFCFLESHARIRGGLPHETAPHMVRDIALCCVWFFLAYSWISMSATVVTIVRNYSH